MWARRIVRWTLVLLLLAWVPESPPQPAPVPHAPPAVGAWMDIGLRLAPDRPWSSWTVYMDLHLDYARTADPTSERVRPGTAEPDVAVELGAEEFSRVLGGLIYVLLREVVDRVLPGDSGS